ncbi:glycosyltransferase family 2 protein [Paenarthrobacter sp. NPDC092416]|uniref:glycosyltransferase family 2 protein n=1 Tax=Paenarthrobacter sp. NPDC092416 TaxID=3364386 RepID=UPI00380FFCC6
MSTNGHTEVPLVSVIMPTFNDRQVIGDAIQSILEQTFDSWELLVVDDASTDGTADFVAEHFTDPRVSIIRMETNSGSGVCRNRAISLARGTFIAVMDADDISMPQRLELQVEQLSQDPQLGAVSAQVLEFGAWGGPVVGGWPTNTSEIRARQLAQKMPIPHPAAMFRRSQVVEVGGYDEACLRAQDFSLLLRLGPVRLATLAIPLVKYRTSRPISLGYVVRNDWYADLARRRNVAQRSGVALDQLPTEIRRTPIGYLNSFKSWLIRNAREQAQLARLRLRARESQRGTSTVDA